MSSSLIATVSSFTCGQAAGKLYNINISSCSCPSFTFRQVPCKHMVYLSLLGLAAQRLDIPHRAELGAIPRKPRTLGLRRPRQYTRCDYPVDSLSFVGDFGESEPASELASAEVESVGENEIPNPEYVSEHASTEPASESSSEDDSDYQPESEESSEDEPDGEPDYDSDCSSSTWVDL